MSRFVVLVLIASAISGLTTGEYKVKPLNTANLTHLSHERKLYHYLLDDYVKDVRPATFPNETVTVNFRMAMLNIVDLHEETGVLEFNAWMTNTWTDPQLTWDPDEFGGLRQIHIPIKRLWRPDIVLYTNAAESDDTVMSPLAVVYSNGMVLWIPHVRVQSWCPLDLTKFPFDEQTCNLKFGSWTYHMGKVDLQYYMNNNKMDLSEYNAHPEWDIVQHDGRREEKVYLCCPERYVSMVFTLNLRRRIQYFSHIYMAPAILMVLLLPSVFLLPPSASEKITLGCGIMITLAVMLAMLERFLPSDHPTVPVVGMFYLTALVLVALSMTFACIVINVSRRRKSSPPSKVVKFIFIELLGRVLCVRSDPYTELVTTMEQPMSKFDSGATDVHVISGDDREDIISGGGRPASSSMVSASDWQVLALVLDRLLLIIFGVACLIVCIAMFSN